MSKTILVIRGASLTDSYVREQLLDGGHRVRMLDEPCPRARPQKAEART